MVLTAKIGLDEDNHSTPRKAPMSISGNTQDYSTRWSLRPAKVVERRRQAAQAPRPSRAQRNGTEILPQSNDATSRFDPGQTFPGQTFSR
jgi:hypothetical protein